MPNPALGYADARPRIHVWRDNSGFSWSHGPTGARLPALSAGAAVDRALEVIEHRPAVIIFEGAGR